MSAALENAFDQGTDGTSARDWLLTIRADPAESTRTSEDASRPALAAVCCAAVAPLEIAAALEAGGVSQQIVQETTGHHDVFDLADELWKTVPYVEPDVPRTRCWRRGNVGDLGRGVLYASPALIIHGLAVAGDYQFRWWTLPLAMTVGWALGQLTAFGGYRMRGRNDARGEARFAALILIVAAMATATSALIAQRTFGGDIESVLCATAITTYMVASSILLLHEEELIGALLLAPAVVASMAVLVVDGQLIVDGQMKNSVAVWCIATSGAATLVAAVRHMGWPMIRRASVNRTDLAPAAQHCLHGVLCGVALSVILLLGTGAVELGSRAAAISIPLLITLGLMEWQLRTFRADVEALGHELEAIDDFAGNAVGIFLRGLAIYVVGVVTAGVAVAVALHVAGSTVPVAVLVAEVALGALYHVDLTLTSLNRLDVVLRAWIIGVAVAGALVAVGLALGADARDAGWWSAHVGVWSALTVLLVAAPRIIAAPCSH